MPQLELLLRLSYRMLPVVVFSQFLSLSLRLVPRPLPLMSDPREFLLVWQSTLDRVVNGLERHNAAVFSKYSAISK